jgi:MFS family permease
MGGRHLGKPMNVRAWIHSAGPVPAECRSSFRHLYLDTAWFGVLAASTMSFVAVYAARQGANAFEIGLLSAGPAVVNLIFALPVGQWLEKQPIDTAVFWTAVTHRFGYLLYVALPLLLVPQVQIGVLITLTLLMSIPGVGLAVGFNALFADAVPPNWRGHVVGIRNALLAVTFIVVSLLCGYILERLPFPAGYQVVFGIGFLGAAMSTFHLWFVTPCPEGRAQRRGGRRLGDLAWPGRGRMLIDSPRPGASLRVLPRRRKLNLLQTEALRRPFGRLVVVLFFFHLTLYLAVPLFPLHWVNQIHLSDQEIGLGTALFYVGVFLGSTQLARFTRRLGNQRLTAIGAILMSAYPAFMALSHGLDLFLVGSAAGGLGWSAFGGSMTNYLLEKLPEDRRPEHLALYNLALNAALLLGSLAGPFIAGFVGVPMALALFAILRLLGALAILRWE